MRKFTFIVIIFIILLLSYKADYDSTDNKLQKSRSGMKIYVDNKTKLQYVGAGFFGGITPRLNVDGSHMKEASDE